MSEPRDTAPIGLAGLEAAAPADGSAGAMLRQARERRGLHIAALAASIKVAPRKLEALEADRYGELPDLTFTRALAQTVCRALKIDAEPVLAKLPQAGDLPRLSRLGEGINARYRESSTRHESGGPSLLRKPVFWATALVLLAALVLALLPERWVPWRTSAQNAVRLANGAPSGPGAVATPASSEAGNAVGAIALPAAVGTAASAVAAAASALIDSVQALPPEALSGPVAGPIAPSPVAGSSGDALQVKASAASWVEVQDARGTVLLSRSVQPGESLVVEGALPLRLTIGNAAGTQLSFRGVAVDLGPNTRDNVARLQLP